MTELGPGCVKTLAAVVITQQLAAVVITQQ
jgi:hypothetical protein